MHIQFIQNQPTADVKHFLAPATDNLMQREQTFPYTMVASLCGDGSASSLNLSKTIKIKPVVLYQPNYLLSTASAMCPIMVDVALVDV